MRALCGKRDRASRTQLQYTLRTRGRLARAEARLCRGAYWGAISNTVHYLRQLFTKLAKKHSKLGFFYEAGLCGDEIYKHLKEKGSACHVLALTRSPGRVVGTGKNDQREAITLARLARAGELSTIWAPNPVYEAMRDLVRATHAAGLYKTEVQPPGTPH